jgi:hypothetical protein
MRWGRVREGLGGVKKQQNPFPTNYDFNICIIIRAREKAQKGKFSISSIFFIRFSPFADGFR